MAFSPAYPMLAKASPSPDRARAAGAAIPLVAGPLAVAVATVVFVRFLHLANVTTVALAYLLVVLLVASSSPPRAAVATSALAMLALNYFYLPPVGTLTIASSENLVAWVTFLAVSLVASQLSSLARRRRDEAVARREELARLFDLSRDILLATDEAQPLGALAASIARRLRLDHVAVELPPAAGGERHALGDAKGPSTRLQLRYGSDAVGCLDVSGRTLTPETLEMLANLAALAVDRAALLRARHQAEVRQRSAELQSALLASLAHDLRTPLTAIRVAVGNLGAPWLQEEQRSDQADIIRIEVARLERLFQNIIQMARIESGAITPDLRFVHPLEITEAARSQVDHSLREHTIALLADEGGDLVRVDPRLTSAALAHLLENAAQYSPPGSTITVTHEVSGEGLQIAVQDEGPGVSERDLPRLFDRFYRGVGVTRYPPGTGMGLAITRGLLAAENGRVWVEERAGLGARFCLFVPAERRTAALAGSSS